MVNQSYKHEKEFLFTRLTPYMKGTMAQWLQILPLEFYLEIFKLHQWQFSIQKIDEKAGLLARWTQVYIFKRLKKESLDKLKKSIPEDQENSIRPQIEAQLRLVTERMKAAPDWNTFVRCFRDEFGLVPFYFSTDTLSEASKKQLEAMLILMSNVEKPKRHSMK
jgi:hypothetical protein